jgi:hypothetical protein
MSISVKEAIAALPKTYEEILELFKKEGIVGVCRDPYDCLFATYLEKVCGKYISIAGNQATSVPYTARLVEEKYYDAVYLGDAANEVACQFDRRELNPIFYRERTALV